MSRDFTDDDIDVMLAHFSPEQLARVRDRSGAQLSHSTSARSASSGQFDASVSSRRSRRSRLALESRSRGGSSCCGDINVVSPTRTATGEMIAAHSSAFTGGGGQTSTAPTPLRTPPITPKKDKKYMKPTPLGYSYLIEKATGHLYMNDEGKAVISRMHELCQQVFRHNVTDLWKKIPDASKEYLIDTLYQEVPQPSSNDRFSSGWMMMRMRDYQSHRRSDAREAVKQGKSKPEWLDTEDCSNLQDEATSTLDKWKPRKDAAKACLDAGSVHHLGSGSYRTFLTDFQAFTNRDPTALEVTSGEKHGLSALIEKLYARGGRAPFDMPLQREELSNADES